MSELTAKMVDDITAKMRQMKQIETFIVLQRDVYDTLKSAYAINSEAMPSWIIRQVDLETDAG